MWKKCRRDHQGLVDNTTLHPIANQRKMVTSPITITKPENKILGAPGHQDALAPEKGCPYRLRSPMILSKGLSHVRYFPNLWETVASDSMSHICIKQSVIKWIRKLTEEKRKFGKKPIFQVRKGASISLLVSPLILQSQAERDYLPRRKQKREHPTKTQSSLRLNGLNKLATLDFPIVWWKLSALQFSVSWKTNASLSCRKQVINNSTKRLRLCF